ncbi:hypothetical protein [Chryseobacterium sp. KCF3-3]|uniref:hypothetical protein n=1 Tax=Chryseobacterium sp. KCF3-3 TaxID=3231511 RepID=UPI0038B27B89
MKKIISLMLFAINFPVFAQVLIGKTSVTNSSVSLEFGSDNRGLVLPWVTNTTSVTGAVDGTMVYDISDHKVKIKYTSGWNDLSVDTTGTTVDSVTGIDGMIIQNAAVENTSAKVSVGIPTSVPGILVLEDSDKSMILPKTASPHLNIINPSPGMIVYDTTAKMLAVFNGNMWSFWQ